VVGDDAYGVVEDVSLSIVAPGVLRNDRDYDGDAMTTSLVAGVSNGDLLFGSDGAFTYIPSQGFTGTDTFTYEAYDGDLYSEEATVILVVNAPAAPGIPWSWGLNANGQLGDGTTTSRKSPSQVNGLSGIADLAGGGYHSLALACDGGVWGWGANAAGQLGDGTYSNRHTPVQMAGLTGVVAIAGGSEHSVAVRADGTVWACGSNSAGQLGDGTTVNRNVPVQTVGITGVMAAEAVSSHSLALKSDGTVWGWGQNNYGQLGDGTNYGRYAPGEVLGLGVCLNNG
jgi:hypothetical protein